MPFFRQCKRRTATLCWPLFILTPDWRNLVRRRRNKRGGADGQGRVGIQIRSFSPIHMVREHSHLCARKFWPSAPQKSQVFKFFSFFVDWNFMFTQDRERRPVLLFPSEKQFLPFCQGFCRNWKHWSVSTQTFLESHKRNKKQTA